MKVDIHKAIGDDVQSVEIVIAKTLPLFDGADWEKRTEDVHNADTSALFQALAKSLPGGTLHRLHAVMVLHYAGLYARPSEMADDLDKGGQP